jgi:hypothetical protein
MHACTRARAVVHSLAHAHTAMSDGFNSCSRVFRFYWWSWSFLTVVLLSVAVAAFTEAGLHYARPFLCVRACDRCVV